MLEDIRVQKFQRPCISWRRNALNEMEMQSNGTSAIEIRWPIPLNAGILQRSAMLVEEEGKPSVVCLNTVPVKCTANSLPVV